MEKGKFNASIGELKHLTKLQDLELIDFEMVQGFGNGLVQLQNIRKMLLIPLYKDEVTKNFYQVFLIVLLKAYKIKNLSFQKVIKCSRHKFEKMKNPIHCKLSLVIQVFIKLTNF